MAKNVSDRDRSADVPAAEGSPVAAGGRPADITHVLHWISPELQRTRKWFGRKIGPGCWESQPLDAYESGRYDVQDVDFMILEDPAFRDAPASVLAEAVARVLARPVSLKEDRDGNGKGLFVIPGWHHKPVRWVDAPVYLVSPASR